MIVLWKKPQFGNTCDFMVAQWGFIQVLHFVRCTQMCFMTQLFLYHLSTYLYNPPLGGTYQRWFWGFLKDTYIRCCKYGMVRYRRYHWYHTGYGGMVPTRHYMKITKYIIQRKFKYIMISFKENICISHYEYTCV